MNEKGGLIFDLNSNSISGYFGSGYINNDSYKNIAKPADIAVNSSTGVIFVVDIKDKCVKPYYADTGLFANEIGILGGTAISGVNNNGKFFYPTSIMVDDTGKILISDTGNCSPYMQLSAIWNPFKRQYILSNKYSGNPKGKIQVFVNNGLSYSCNINDADARQFLLHGTKKNDGYVLDVSSIFSDANYLYVADTINKKIFVFENAANIFNSEKNFNTTPKINYPVAKPVLEEAVDVDTDIDDKIGFIRFQGVFSFGAYENKFLQFKDMVKINNTLAVTDMMGRIFFFNIN